MIAIWLCIHSLVVWRRSPFNNLHVSKNQRHFAAIIGHKEISLVNLGWQILTYLRPNLICSLVINWLCCKCCRSVYIRRILTFFLYYCSFSAVIRRFIPFSCFVPHNYAAVVPDPALSRGLPLKKHHNLWLFCILSISNGNFSAL